MTTDSHGVRAALDGRHRALQLRRGDARQLDAACRRAEHGLAVDGAGVGLPATACRRRVADFTEFAPRLSRTTLSPGPPSSTSAPGPPISTSSPSPPSSVSLPAPPSRMSSPSPPSSVSSDRVGGEAGGVDDVVAGQGVDRQAVVGRRSAPVTVTRAARPMTCALAGVPATVTTSSPLVALTMTLSAAPSSPPPVPARSVDDVDEVGAGQVVDGDGVGAAERVDVDRSRRR